MCGASGRFSGIGHNPQLTRTCCRISRARCCHSCAEEIAGKLRGVSRLNGWFVTEVSGAAWDSATLRKEARAIARHSRAYTCVKWVFMLYRVINGGSKEKLKSA